MKVHVYTIFERISLVPSYGALRTVFDNRMPFFWSDSWLAACEYVVLNPVFDYPTLILGEEKAAIMIPQSCRGDHFGGLETGTHVFPNADFSADVPIELVGIIGEGGFVTASLTEWPLKRQPQPKAAP